MNEKREKACFKLAAYLQVTLKEVIHCESDVSTSDDFPTSESNGKELLSHA